MSLFPITAQRAGYFAAATTVRFGTPMATLLADAGRADPGIALGVLEPEALQAARAKGVSLAEVAFESDLCELELVI